MESQTKITPHIRWMIRRDMAEVQAIEEAQFEFPWSEANFIECLRQRICIGRVAEFQGQVIGFSITETLSRKVHILNIAVLPDFARQGVGSALIQNVKNFRNPICVSADGRETNLGAQLFLQANGFVAMCTLKNFYEDTTEDAINFRYLTVWSECED